MLKSSLFILFCETDADLHQIATFVLELAVYFFLGIQFRFWTRTLFYDTVDKTLLHIILVTAPKCGSSSSVGM